MMSWQTTHPEDPARLVDDPSLLPIAVEEFLRPYGPATMGREIVAETGVGDCTVCPSEKVLLTFSAANRDPVRFPQRAPREDGSPGSPAAGIARLDLGTAQALAANLGLARISLANLAVFQIALLSPRVAAALNGMLRNLLIEDQLDGRLRELIIMRIGWATGAVYEWTQHWPVLTGMDVPEGDLLGVRNWSAYDGFGPAERAVLSAKDDWLATGTISDESWAACAEVLDGEGELIELLAVIGNWMLFANLLRTLKVPLEDGVAPWPPDGRDPMTAAPDGT